MVSFTHHEARHESGVLPVAKAQGMNRASTCPVSNGKLSVTSVMKYVCGRVCKETQPAIIRKNHSKQRYWGMMKIVCVLLGHKITSRCLAAYDPAFGGLEIQTCRCGKKTIVEV